MLWEKGLPGGRRLRSQRALSSACLTIAAVITWLLVAGGSARAASSAFAARFQANDNGAITTVGNNLETCPLSAANCANSKTGASPGDDNDFNMIYIDADGNSSTFNSSTSQLSLPSGATVLWAGLYWGARTAAGVNGVAAAGNPQTMLLQVPGASNYQTITSQQAFGPVSGDSAYQQFASVTSLVQAAGAGTYWGANVAAATGQDRYAGWSLVVVYRSPSLPLRNLTVFDGFTLVGSGAPQTITVNGFLAPLAGTVATQLGLVAYEGDLGLSGDSATLNKTQLATALSPGTNFFNATDDNNGASVTTRTPADQNMFGFDIKQLGASGVIPNGATSATINLTSTGDTYFPGVVTSAINLYAPDFTSSSKTAVDLSGNNPAQPGDTLQYTINFANSGADPSANTVLTDVLPPNVTYVPGSLAIQTGPGAGSLTDGAGDDRGEFNASARRVTVRLGTGATASSGGSLAINASTSVTFKVTLDSAAGGTTVSNTGALSYTAQTSGLAATYQTPAAQTPVAAVADLDITKSLAPDPAPAGAPLTATLTVTNHGPNTAGDVVVTDPLPSGMTASAASSSAGSCALPAGGSGTVTCQLGALPIGQPATITIHGATSPSSTATSLTNVAQATTSSVDPDPANNVAATTVSVSRSADLSVTKAASPSTVVPGRSTTFTLTATNDGPSDATNVTVSDAAANPAQLSLETPSTAFPGATCTGTGAAVQCAVASLPVGQSMTITIVGDVSSAVAGGTALPDTAAVASQTPDPDATNNQVTATVTAAPPQSDVALTKRGFRQTNPGGPVNYTLTATNRGPSDATNVVVTDTLPAGVTITGAASTRGTCTIASGTVTCSLDTLVAGPGQAGASATITLNGTLASSVAAPTITNTAVVTADDLAPVGGDNRAIASTLVSGLADLSITKTADSSTVPNPGDTVTYTMTITNNGPSSALDPGISDQLPTSLDFVSATPSVGTCAAPSDNTLNCDLGNNLADGATVTVTVVMQTPAGGPVPTSAAEVASVSSLTNDPNFTNNTAEWDLSPNPAADLSITKASSFDAATGQITYTLTAANGGPSPATGVSVSDPLPSGLTFVSASVDNSGDPSASFTCANSSGTVTCATGITATMPVGMVVIKIVAAVDPSTDTGTAISNTATIAAVSPNDPSDANNTDTAATSVNADADLAVSCYEINAAAAPPPCTSDGNTSSGSPGSTQTLLVELTNHGPFDAKSVTFNIDLNGIDAAVRLAGITGATCILVNGSLECTLADPATGSILPPGASATVTIPTRITSYAPGGAAGTTDVTASTTTPDPNLANNTDAAHIDVTAPIADLKVAKSALTNPIPAGGTFRYQLSVQASVFVDPITGNSVYGADAHDVVVTDPLPAGLTATGASASQGACTIDPLTNSVTCDLGTLSGPVPGPGPPPATITITGRAPSGLSGSVVNTGTATSSTTLGPDSATTATINTPVVARADLQLFKTVDNNPLIAGGQAGYTLTAVNAGPADAPGTTLTDTLPNGVTFDPAASDPLCNASGQTVTCGLGTMAAGTHQSIRIVGTTLPNSTATAVTNNASIASSVTDPDTSNNTAAATAAVTQLADVGMVLTASTSTPTVGGDVTFSLSLTNAGPSDSVNPVATFRLPPGLQVVSCTMLGLPCTAGTGPPANAVCSIGGAPVVITCTAPRIVAGFAAVTGILVTKVTDSVGTGQITLPGQITSDTPDSNLANNSTSQTLTPQVLADTAVTKTLITSPVIAGEPVSYRLTAVNNGPSNAPAVTFSDTLPAGTSFASGTVENGSGSCTSANQSGDGLAATVVTCSVGKLDVGAGASVILTLNTSSALNGELSNTASVGSSGLDPLIDNNTSTVTAAVGPPLPPPRGAGSGTDVGVSLKAVRSPIAPGDTAGYVATVRNHGPSAATGVILTTSMPAKLTALQSSAARPRISPRQSGCSISRRTLICDVGPLAVGASATYTFTGETSRTIRIGTKLTAVASTSHGEPDPMPANDADAATVVVKPAAKLKVAKTVDHSTTATGGKLTYTITVGNSGPATARTPTVTDRFSARVTVISAKASSGSCHGHRPLRCTLGSIRPGGHATIIVAARAQAPGTLRNTATVTTSTALSPGSKLSASATTQVRARIGLLDTPSTLQVLAGQRVSFYLNASNPNSFTLHHVSVCDPLPPDLIFDAASRGARVHDRVVCWTVPALGPHASRITWLRGVTRTSVSTTIRDVASAVATDPQTVVAHAHARVQAIIPPHCARPSLRFGPPTAVSAC